MKAHRAIDRLVDKLFGIHGRHVSQEERVARLLDQYAAAVKAAARRGVEFVDDTEEPQGDVE